MELVVLCVVLLWASTASGVVQFTQVDYAAREGTNDFIRVDIDIAGILESDVTVEVIPLTVEAFMSTYSQPPPSGIEGSDHAESSDFSSAQHTLHIIPATRDVSVQITIVDDDLSEPDEVFLLVLNSSEDAAGMRRNVSIARILRDLSDRVIIQFSGVEFSISEDEGEVSSLHVVKVGESEDPISFTVELETDFTDKPATRGDDFEVGNLLLMFQPNDVSLTVSFTIMEDPVPENVETFQFRLEAGSELSVLGTNTTATIEIIDNDGLTAGFIQPAQPSLQEGQTANICVALLQPVDIQLSFNLTLSIILSGATEEHFNIENTCNCLISNGELEYEITLGPSETRCCFNVTTVDDEVLETSRVLMMTLTEEQMSHPLLTVAPHLISVTITDNDGTPNAPENLTLELVNDDMDLLIMWDVVETELRPMERFLVKVTVSDIPIPSETEQEPVVETFEYVTQETQYTIHVNRTKQYTIAVCSSNTFGVNSTQNVLHYVIPVPSPSSTVPSPTVQSHTVPSHTVQSPAERSTGLKSGAITLIVILAFLFIFLCCILLIFFLFCLTCWNTSEDQPFRRRYKTPKLKKYKKKKRKSTKKTVIV